MSCCWCQKKKFSSVCASRKINYSTQKVLYFNMQVNVTFWSEVFINVNHFALSNTTRLRSCVNESLKVVVYYYLLQMSILLFSQSTPNFTLIWFLHMVNFTKQKFQSTSSFLNSHSFSFLLFCYYEKCKQQKIFFSLL